MIRSSPAIPARATINTTRRAALAVLEEARVARSLTLPELEAWSTLTAWWQRHRHSRRSRLPSLIDAALHRVAIAERRLAEEGGRHARTSLAKARLRLARYLREDEEIARG